MVMYIGKCSSFPWLWLQVLGEYGAGHVVGGSREGHAEKPGEQKSLLGQQRERQEVQEPLPSLNSLPDVGEGGSSQGLIAHRISRDQRSCSQQLCPKGLKVVMWKRGARVEVGANELHHPTCVLESWPGEGRRVGWGPQDSSLGGYRPQGGRAVIWGLPRRADA